MRNTSTFIEITLEENEYTITYFISINNDRATVEFTLEYDKCEKEYECYTYFDRVYNEFAPEYEEDVPISEFINNLSKTYASIYDELRLWEDFSRFYNLRLTLHDDEDEELYRIEFGEKDIDKIVQLVRDNSDYNL